MDLLMRHHVSDHIGAYNNRRADIHTNAAWFQSPQVTSKTVMDVLAVNVRELLLVDSRYATELIDTGSVDGKRSVRISFFLVSRWEFNVREQPCELPVAFSEQDLVRCVSSMQH